MDIASKNFKAMTRSRMIKFASDLALPLAKKVRGLKVVRCKLYFKKNRLKRREEEHKYFLQNNTSGPFRFINIGAGIEYLKESKLGSLAGIDDEKL